MENGIHSQEMSYWSREVAELLGISDSTLRKYCLILEQNGYRLLRDEYNRRAFLERDVQALRRFQELAKSNEMTFEDAAVAVISAIKESEITDIVPSVSRNTSALDHTTQRYEELIGKLQLLIEHNQIQETFNRVLLERLEKQENFIQTILKETQLQLVATQEQELQLERQKRITNMITQKRVESSLATEALEIWHQLPESERLKKAGFFRKKEDRDKKERFIRDYIHKHFEQRLLKEYELYPYER